MSSINNKGNIRRRDFIKAAAGIIAAPTIVPSSIFAGYRPNDKINIGQIGYGRIAKIHDLPSVLGHDMCRVVAVADVDLKRAKDGKNHIDSHYAKATGKEKYLDTKVYQDYREMLEKESLDAVIISTPDHWHARPAIEAALKGIDIYLQKPASLTIAEGRAMSDAMHRTGAIFQIGSQQRSASNFRKGCELVRNGAIGKIKNIEIALAFDSACGEEPEMPIPENLDYEMWLGSTPEVYYTEKRVHPQGNYGRPGWLRCEQFGAGMITGWGAHHLDTAHWGMGTEYTGPVEIEGTGNFPSSGLWNVHLDYDIHYKYANGVHMHVCNKYPNGIKFIGEDGWIFVSRGSVKVTSSDPSNKDGVTMKALDASEPGILNYDIGPNGIVLPVSEEHHLNWLECIRSRKQPIAPAEVAHRSCSACLLGHIAMKLPRKLYWNPDREQFVNDPEANKMLSRPGRSPYGIEHLNL